MVWKADHRGGRPGSRGPENPAGFADYQASKRRSRRSIIYGNPSCGSKPACDAKPAGRKPLSSKPELLIHKRQADFLRTKRSLFTTEFRRRSRPVCGKTKPE